MQIDTSLKIDNCPFCGAVAKKLKHFDLYRFNHAEHCWFSGKDYRERLSLIEAEEIPAWNTRSTKSC